jgi:hypothetical protein
MSIKMDNDQNIPINTDACFEYYEQLASQEEVYLEEIEEEVVTILTAYVSSASQNDRSPMTDICVARESDLEIEGPMTNPKINPKINPRMAGDPEAPLVDASEELITGDADDPPLSEEVVQEMLPDSPARGSDL